MNDELTRRRILTFEQAEGVAQLPRQLKRDEVPGILKAKLFSVISEVADYRLKQEGLQRGLSKRWSKAFEMLWIERDSDTSLKFDRSRDANLSRLKFTFDTGEYTDVYGITQMLVRLVDDHLLTQGIERLLVEQHSAYRLIDGDTLVPISSEADSDTVLNAFFDLQEGGMVGARQHLKEASTHMSSGNFADSVRESIHSVESTVRNLTGEPSLARALAVLSAQRPMHEAFRQSLLKLYGYSSDEKGIRHPLLDSSDAAVTEKDAILIFSMCAAFNSYFATSFTKVNP